MNLQERLSIVLALPPKQGSKKTKAGLARACGITAPSVNDWFSGKSQSIDGKHLTKAAAYLECSAHWLSTGQGQMVELEDKQERLSDPLGFMVSQYKYLLEHLPEDIRKEAHREAIDALSMHALRNERRS